jgi:DAACS family dicarboxylate/amino acid:cation (Na+ or H+) symporter
MIQRWLRSLPVQIVAGMVVGALVGMQFGKDAVVFGELGKLVIQMVKATAAPLMFLAIVEAVITADIRWRDGGRMMAIVGINTALALAIGLTCSNVLKPGLHLSAEKLTGIASTTPVPAAPQSIDLMKSLSSYVPTSWLQPFAENLIISLVLLALLTGFALVRVRAQQQAAGETRYRAVEDAIGTGLRMLTVILGWIIRLIPIAVFGVVAKSVGEYGFKPITGLAWYVGVALLGMLLHVLIVHQGWIVFRARMRLRDFWRNAREPAVYAFGANSSLATLPVTLATLDRIGVSRASSRLGACVGTNFNNDGIVLYEGMAVMLVAQACGMELTFSQQLLAAFSCMFAAIGVAGVPEAGFVSLALVLGTVGLPTELLPLLLTVDWIIARTRSVVNVLSDMVVSISLDGPRRAQSPTTALNPP